MSDFFTLLNTISSPANQTPKSVVCIGDCVAVSWEKGTGTNSFIKLYDSSLNEISSIDLGSGVAGPLYYDAANNYLFHGNGIMLEAYNVTGNVLSFINSISNGTYLVLKSIYVDVNKIVFTSHINIYNGTNYLKSYTFDGSTFTFNRSFMDVQHYKHRITGDGTYIYVSEQLISNGIGLVQIYSYNIATGFHYITQSGAVSRARAGGLIVDNGTIYWSNGYINKQLFNGSIISNIVIDVAQENTLSAAKGFHLDSSSLYTVETGKGIYARSLTDLTVKEKYTDSGVPDNLYHMSDFNGNEIFIISGTTVKNLSITLPIIPPTIVDYPKRIRENSTYFGFKLEAVHGVVESLRASDYQQYAHDIELNIDIASYGQMIATGNFSNFPSIAGSRYASITFKVEAYVNDFPSVAPQYFKFLQACGWKQTTYGTTGVSIVPDHDLNNISGTFGILYPQESGDGTFKLVEYVISGAMGKVSIASSPVSPVILSFEFIGALHTIRTMESSPAPTDGETMDASVRTCVRVDDISTSFLSKYLGSITGEPSSDPAYVNETLIDSVVIHSNEAVQLSSNMSMSAGNDRALIVDRASIGELNFVVDAASPIFDPIIEHSAGNSITLTYNGAVTLQLSVSGMELTEPLNLEGENGIVTSKSVFIISESSIELLHGSK